MLLLRTCVMVGHHHGTIRHGTLKLQELAARMQLLIRYHKSQQQQLQQQQEQELATQDKPLQQQHHQAAIHGEPQQWQQHSQHTGKDAQGMGKQQTVQVGTLGNQLSDILLYVLCRFCFCIKQV